MSDGFIEDSSDARIIAVKEKLFKEIMENEALAAQIFSEFIIGVVKEDERPVKTLTEIAKNLLLESFTKNKTIAKEMISWVGQAMYERQVRNAIGQITFESQEAKNQWLSEVKNRIEAFNNARNKKIKLQIAQLRKQSGEMVDFQMQGNLAQGANIYSAEFVNRLIKLENNEDYRYPEGHRSGGHLNMILIARTLQSEFPDYKDITPKKLNDLKRKNQYYKVYLEDLEG
ncbi:MAG: hypothetical protein ABI721_05330 [Candidatus Dojkabacteria bacterium]